MFKKMFVCLLTGFSLFAIVTCILPDRASNAMRETFTARGGDLASKSAKNDIKINIDAVDHHIRFASSKAEIEAGKKVFEDQRCFQCHSIHGVGGAVGPDLSKIGERRNALWLKAHLRNPKSAFPFTIMPSFKGSSEELDALVDYLSSLKNKHEDHSK